MYQRNNAICEQMTCSHLTSEIKVSYYTESCNKQAILQNIHNFLSKLQNLQITFDFALSLRNSKHI